MLTIAVFTETSQDGDLCAKNYFYVFPSRLNPQTSFTKEEKKKCLEPTSPVQTFREKIKKPAVVKKNWFSLEITLGTSNLYSFESSI